MDESELFFAHYSFGRHGRDSVGVISQIKIQAEDFFSDNQLVRNVFIIEDAHLADSDFQKVRGFRERNLSCVDSYIQAVHSAQKGRIFPPNELLRRKRQLLGDPQTAFALSLLSMVDELPQIFHPELLLEHYPNPVARNLSRKKRAWDQAEKYAFQMAFVGRFDKAVELELEYLRGFAADITVRNATYISMLKEAQEQCLTSGQQTRVFTRVGSHHDRLLRYIEEDPEIELKPPQLTWTYDPGSERKLPAKELLIALEDNPGITFDQERVLRGMFGDMMYNGIPSLPADVLEETDRIELACEWATTLPIEKILETLDQRPKR